MSAFQRCALGGLLLVGAWLPPGVPLTVVVSLALILAVVFPVPRTRWVRAVVLLLLLASQLASWRLAQWTPDRVDERLEDAMVRTVERLESQGQVVATRLGEQLDRLPDSDREATIFRLMDRAAQWAPGPADSYFLVDGDGVAVAWTGAGLRYSLPEAELPSQGGVSLRSFTADTVGWIVPLPEAGPGWRLVVGFSESALSLPSFLEPPEWMIRDAHREQGWQSGRLWELRTRDTRAETVPGTPAVAMSHGEWRLLVRASALGDIAREVRYPAGLALVIVVLLLLDQLAAGRPRRTAVAALSLSAVLVCLSAGWVSLWGAILVLIGGGMIELTRPAGLLGRRADRLGWFRILPPALAGGFGVLAVELALSGRGGATGWMSVGRDVLPGPELLVLVTSCWLFTVACFLLASAPVTQGIEPALPLLVSLALALAALALPAGSAAVAIAVVALLPIAAVRFPPTVMGHLGLLVAAALGTGLLWSVAVEDRSREHLQSLLDPRDSVFASSGRSSVAEQIGAHFEELDLESLTLGLEPQASRAEDLALLLWLTSPLAASVGPSAVAVELPENSQFFGFGLDRRPGGEELVLDGGTGAGGYGRWVRDSMLRGRSVLSPESDARVSFYLIPVPEPRGSGASPSSSLARRFLLGEGADRGSWYPEASLVVGPWDGDPALALGGRPRSVERGSDLLVSAQRTTDPSPDSSEGAIERWFEESFTLAVLHLPEEDVLGRIGRVTMLAATLVLVSVLVAIAFLAVWIPGRPGRLTNLLGSFARRLILVFSVFTAVPIVFLGVLLLQAFSHRLLEVQRSSGEEALNSAERMIGDYLSSLEPGFSVTRALDADLMSWVSLVVRHEVNLYWRGSVLTSSRPELFAAGLLPSQIPGDVYAAIQLEGRSVAARFNQSDPDTTYLELYRAVELPGGGAGSGLFLSVPLLAQEAEAEETLASLLGLALTLATFLSLLLVLIASRFASAFTEPITAIVEGTGRIALGAHSLGLRPRVPELKALADAIDIMAEKIAIGRERLVREKRVVDTVIANIKSAVVSFGSEDRVIMANREAADLLGVRSGDSLEDLVARVESEELARLIERRPTIAERSSVRLGDDSPEGSEWTVQWLPIGGEGDPTALLVLEDVTEVLRAQRLAAWAEMARIIAHEIKNPLTPIQLSADHLRQVWENSPDRIGDVLIRCVDNISAQVEELRVIAGEFSTYSRIPASDKNVADLVETVERVVESYQAGRSDSLEITCDLPEEPVNVLHDPRLFSRVLRNLFENSIRACEGSGRIAVSLSIGKCSQSERRWAKLRVRDNGPGVAVEDLPRIFEPSFSASSGGTGLGLPIARGIIEDHGGTIDARNASRAEKVEGLAGLVVSILLPVVEA